MYVPYLMKLHEIWMVENLNFTDIAGIPQMWNHPRHDYLVVFIAVSTIHPMYGYINHTWLYLPLQ